MTAAAADNKHQPLQDATFTFMTAHCHPAAARQILGKQGLKTDNHCFLSDIIEHFPEERDVRGADQLKERFSKLFDTIKYFHCLHINAHTSKHGSKPLDTGPEPDKADMMRLESAPEILGEVKTLFEEAYKTTRGYEVTSNLENLLLAAAQAEDFPKEFAGLVQHLINHVDHKHSGQVLTNVVERLSREPGFYDRTEELREKYPDLMEQHPQAKQRQMMTGIMEKTGAIIQGEVMLTVHPEYLLEDFATAMDQLITDIAPVAAEAKKLRNAGRMAEL